MNPLNINAFAKSQIAQIKNKCSKICPLVVIQCTAYNHESYLRDALEGFIMQKTDFPFVAIVHDDASTDKTADIIREYAEKYPEIILPIYEAENQYSKKGAGVGPIMNLACRESGAKYIAICEGDDYWTDSLKLQKQVDFLESNLEYGMCYTKTHSYSQQKKQIEYSWGGPSISFDELIIDNTIPTLTTLFRIHFLKEYNEEVQHISKEWRMSDYPLWLYIAYKSKIKFMDEITGVYRILSNSASHPKNHIKQLEFTQSSFKLRLNLLDYLNLGNHPYYETLKFNEIYLNMRLSILNHNQETNAIKIFRRSFLTRKIPIKQRLKAFKWFISPKILSKMVNIRFRKIHNQ